MLGTSADVGKRKWNRANGQGKLLREGGTFLRSSLIRGLQDEKPNLSFFKWIASFLRLTSLAAGKGKTERKEYLFRARYCDESLNFCYTAPCIIGIFTNFIFGPEQNLLRTENEIRIFNRRIFNIRQTVWWMI